MSSVQWLSAAEVLVVGSPALHDWYLGARVRVEGYQFMPQFRAKHWDGYYSPGKYCRKVPGRDLYEFRGSRGLLYKFSSLGIVGQLPSFLTGEEVNELVAMIPSTFYDYQRQAVAASLIHGWGRIALATNSGKGAVIALLCSFLARRGKRCLILCDEVEVFGALKKEVQTWAGFLPDLVEQGVQEPPPGAVVLAMVPTLARRIEDPPKDKAGKPPMPAEERAAKKAKAKVWREWLLSFTGALLDEADKADAPTWKGILSKLKNTIYRIGFSGTFLDNDKHKALVYEELMGPVLLRIQNQELIRREISAKPRVTLYPFNPRVGAIWKTPGWKELTPTEQRSLVYEKIIYNLERHSFVASLIRRKTPTCIIVTRVDHGQQLEEHIPDSVFLSGADSDSTRDKELARFEQGDFMVLIVTKILDRGSNRLGHVDDLIFAGAEGSTRQVLQRIGRGLRRGAKGKAELRLVDIIDSGHPFLDHAAQKRIDLYRAEGFEVDVAR